MNWRDEATGVVLRWKSDPSQYLEDVIATALQSAEEAGYARGRAVVMPSDEEMHAAAAAKWHADRTEEALAAFRAQSATTAKGDE